MNLKFIILLFLFFGFKNIILSQPIVNIGNQVWMLGNLNVEKFRNGDLIKFARYESEWKNANSLKEPAWCYVNYNRENNKNIEKLYNWYAVNDSRGLCPTGWHIPNESDWKDLIINIGGENKFQLLFNKNSLNDQKIWALKFSGFRNNTGNFEKTDTDGFWWSSSEFNSDYAHFFRLNKESGFYRSYEMKSMGYSVKCIKN